MKKHTLSFIVGLAESAGRLAQKMRAAGGLSIGYKNDKDIVSEADMAVEKLIADGIRERFPSDGIWGEEGGRNGASSDFLWIVDPIDGTTSFVHGQPFYSVSIGLQYRGETIAGVVNAPALGEIFSAEKSSGASLNGKRISVSRRSRLIESVLSTGFACVRAGMERNNLENFCRILPKIRGVRRFGSAAIDLSYVACGRLEGFWEMNLKQYDICAGVLILEEAGGKVSDFDGGARFPEHGLAASNGLIHREMLDNIGLQSVTGSASPLRKKNRG